MYLYNDCNDNLLKNNNVYDNGNHLKKAVISFKVKKSWIKDNNINVSKISLNKYHNDNWKKLPCKSDCSPTSKLVGFLYPCTPFFVKQRLQQLIKTNESIAKIKLAHKKYLVLA